MSIKGWQHNQARDERDLMHAMGRLLCSFLEGCGGLATAAEVQPNETQTKLTASLRTTLFACMLLELRNRPRKTVQ